jgi:hypothetical protein
MEYSLVKTLKKGLLWTLATFVAGNTASAASGNNVTDINSVITTGLAAVIVGALKAGNNYFKNKNK